MMTQKSLHPPIGRSIIYGAIGGFVGGLVMYAVMSGVMLAIDMGANCFAVIIALITGQQYSNGLVPLGVSVHLITSTVIGTIFGVVISAVNKLRITGFAKGLGFGVATGLIAFVIIFLPIAITVMPPKMMDLMNAMNSQMMMSEKNGKGTMMSGSSSSSSSGMMSTNKMSGSSDTPSDSSGMTGKSTMTEKSGMNGKSGMMSTGSSSSGMNSQMAMMPNVESLQSSIIGGSLLGHVVYGAVLGTIVTVLLKKTSRGETKISR